MKIKKKLAALALAVSTLATATAGAEHPSAEQYRQILQSGNFYLEYSDDSLQSVEQEGNSCLSVLACKNGKRLKSTVTIERTKSKSWTSFLPIVGGIDFGDRKIKMKRGARNLDSMYDAGRYYIFHRAGLAPSINNTVWLTDRIGGKQVKQEAHVLLENQLHAEALDVSEGWEYVRGSLALPDVLSVFLWNDPYWDNTISMPVFQESKKIEIDKKEYDCDQYAADIKSASGTIIAKIMYEAIYDVDGKLTQINKSYMRNGKSFVIDRILVLELTGALPENAFFISEEPMKVYAAGMGDVNDFLGIDVPVGMIGGASTNGK